MNTLKFESLRFALCNEQQEKNQYGMPYLHLPN